VRPGAHWDTTLDDLALVLCIRRHAGERTIDPDGQPCLACLEAIAAIDDVLRAVVDAAAGAGFEIGRDGRSTERRAAAQILAFEDVATVVLDMARDAHHTYRALRDVYRGEA